LLLFVGLVVAAWITSVFSLNKLYQEKLREAGEDTEAAPSVVIGNTPAGATT